jgi:hypothetical protein
MNKQNKQNLHENMNSVISTSIVIRDQLLDESVPLSDRNAKLKVFQAAINANKSIVSATITQLNIDKLSDNLGNLDEN